MDPGATRRHDDPDSQQDRGSNHHPKLRCSQLDGTPRESPDQDQKTEDVSKESHKVGQIWVGAAGVQSARSDKCGVSLEQGKELPVAHRRLKSTCNSGPMILHDPSIVSL